MFLSTKLIVFEILQDFDIAYFENNLSYVINLIGPFVLIAVCEK